MATRSLEATKTIRFESIGTDPPITAGGTTAKSDDLEPAVVFMAWQVAKTEPHHRRMSESKRQTSDLPMLPFVWLG